MWWLTDPDDTDPDEPFSPELTLHVVAVAPDGSAVDITGRQPIENLLFTWGAHGRLLGPSERAAARDSWAALTGAQQDLTNGYADLLLRGHAADQRILCYLSPSARPLRPR